MRPNETMTPDEAYAAGREVALRGDPITHPPHEDVIFLAWIRGYRDGQTFDPACERCKGTGRRKASGDGEYASCELVCHCNTARPPRSSEIATERPDEPEPHQGA